MERYFVKHGDTFIFTSTQSAESEGSEHATGPDPEPDHILKVRLQVCVLSSCLP